MTPIKYLSSHRTFIFVRIVNSPVVGFYISRSRPLWWGCERLYCLLAHKYGCFTLLRWAWFAIPDHDQWYCGIRVWRSGVGTWTGGDPGVPLRRCTRRSKHSHSYAISESPSTHCPHSFTELRLLYWVSLPTEFSQPEVFLIAPGLTSPIFYVTSRALLIPGRHDPRDTTLRVIHPELEVPCFALRPAWLTGSWGWMVDRQCFRIPPTQVTSSSLRFLKVVWRTTLSEGYSRARKAGSTTRPINVQQMSRVTVRCSSKAGIIFWPCDIATAKYGCLSTMLSRLLGCNRWWEPFWSARMQQRRLVLRWDSLPLIALVVITEDLTVVTWRLSATPTGGMLF